MIFRHFRKIAKSDLKLRHVRPHGTTRPLWTDINEILYLIILRKSVEKIQVSSKSGKNDGQFTKRHRRNFESVGKGSKCLSNILCVKAFVLLDSVGQEIYKNYLLNDFLGKKKKLHLYEPFISL